MFVTSFTRAAAAELIGRDLPLASGAVGTLHSHCFRALGQPQLAEVHLKQWNEEFPHYALSGGLDPNLEESSSVDAYATDAAAADAEAAEYQLLRNRLVPRELWPNTVRAFAKQWEGWCNENDYTDFTGLIERGCKDMLYPPNGARIGFVDEAQDLTPLQLSLVRAWGKQLDYFILVGDDDQCLYSFSGATSEAFLNPPLEPEYKRVLGQSHRVPAKVQSLAVKWIKKIKRREEKQYLPRDHEGEVRVCEDGNFKRPEPILEDAQKYLAKGKTVMFLAPCSYQLSPLVKLLRSEGIPFHNPYRRSRGDWNPLAPRKGTSATDRLVSFIEPNGPRFGEDTLWDIRQLYAWTDVCASEGLLVHGAKTKIKALAKKEKSLTLDQVLDVYTDLFIPEGLDAAIRLNPGWLFDQLRAGFSERMRFPLEILRRLGREALREEPQCIVGTVHSVKGGQADAVYVVPDISLSNWKACQEDAGARDSVVRLMYVAMTRARESLIITGAATPCNPLAAISGGIHA